MASARHLADSNNMKRILVIATLLIGLILTAEASRRRLLTATSSGGGGGVTCSGSVTAGDTERFESGSGAFCLTGWTETDTSSKLDTYNGVQYVTGSKSMRVDLDNAAQSVIYANPADDAVSLRFYLRLTNTVAIGAGNFITILQFDNEATFAGESIVGLDFRINGDNTTSLRLRNLAGSITYGPALAMNTWYRVELDAVRNATSTLRVFSIGGAQFGSDATITAGDAAMTYLAIGKVTAVTGAASMWIENFTLSTGSTFPIGADE